MRVFNRFKGDESGAIVDITDEYCPGCGKQTVFIEQGEGDYYQGPSYYCKSCNYAFSLPSGAINNILQWDDTK